jgi:tetratricopeptide (TPR) repeat protein
MKARRKATVVVALLLAALFATSAFLQQKVESARGKEATLEEVLYLPSSKMLKRMSLGYSALLADIYWTRAVQYFGGKHIQRSTRYDLLAPLLEITTDLDPHLIPAYQDGSVFLSQAPPWGAGQPDKAVALLEKGVRNNPEYWRMFFTLGFIHYLDRKDYKAAQEAFERGSEVPGALPWMKLMAARMAEHAAEIDTAITLWRGVYDMSKDKDVRQTALNHIASLTADAQMMELERIIEAYRKQTGRIASNWTELEQAGLLRGIPLDPTGSPYKLNYGAVQVEDPKKFPFLGDGRGKR